MIRCKISKYDKCGAPVLSAKDIESYAQQVLYEFCPMALKEPTKLDPDRMIEQYMGFNLRYEDLTNNQSILGATYFDGGNTFVYDRINNDIKEVYIRDNTIIIDNHLLDSKLEGRYNHTAFHEVGHSGIHFSILPDKQQISFLEPIKSNIILCRKNILDIINKRDLITKEDWQEWQASFFSTCIIMPYRPVNEVIKHFLYKNGYTKGVIEPKYTSDLEVMHNYLPLHLAELFGASKESAFNRIKYLGYYVEDSYI